MSPKRNATQRSAASQPGRRVGGVAPFLSRALRVGPVGARVDIAAGGCDRSVNRGSSRAFLQGGSSRRTRSVVSGPRKWLTVGPLGFI
jgi:hypothetical protein